MTALELHSQTNDPDKIWLPRRDALNVLAKIERLKADSAELILAKEEINDLYELAESHRTSLKNYADHVKVLDLRIDNLKTQTDVLTRALKKQKRKTILSTVSGIVVSLGLGFLLITK